ncbi:MAG: MFS transporter, partial [Chloroflexi bacterium]|nr:MFS transporter [Chloroflexota bacterium]
RLLLLSSLLSGIAQGIFNVDFNLYILSMGMNAALLGRILSVGPYAHAIGSIPIGFFGETVGYKRAFILIYLLAGLCQLLQVATRDVWLIMAAAFVAGLAFSGDFVVRLPFLAANSDDNSRAHVFSASSVLTSVAMAIGSFIAGYLPNLFARVAPDLTISYRYTLCLAGILTLIGVLPILMIADDKPVRKHKISLHPYLWGMDRFTVQTATVEFFIGLTMGLVTTFMNVFYVYWLKTSREFFGNVNALALLPMLVVTLLGPVVAPRVGKVRTIVTSRLLIPASTLVIALTTNPFLTSGAYWAYRAFFAMSQSLWFAFVMETAAAKAKMAVSAWLEITFWVGMGIAAQVTGSFLSQSNYTAPFYVATVAAAMAALLTQVFVGSSKKQPAQG